METGRGFALDSTEQLGWRLFHFGGRETRRLVHSGLLQTDEIYSPLRVSLSRHRNKRSQTRTLVLAFPGYLFIRCGASAASLSDEGISCSPVVFSGRVAVIDDIEMARIRSLEQRWLDAPAVDPGQTFFAGDRVSIVSGAFAGISAMVKQVSKGNSRAILTIMGSSLDFEISCCLLDKSKA